MSTAILPCQILNIFFILNLGFNVISSTENMNPFLPWPSTKSDEVEEAQEVTEGFAVSGTPVQGSAAEQNPELSAAAVQQNQPSPGAIPHFSTAGQAVAGAAQHSSTAGQAVVGAAQHSSTAGQATAGVAQPSSLEQLPTAVDVPSPSSERHSATGAIPKTTMAGASSDSKRSDPIPIKRSPTDESKLFWEETGAIPKYLTKEYAEKAPKYLPPFKKPNASKPKTEQSSKLLEESDVMSSLASTSSAELSTSSAEPSKERRSSRSERAQFVRQHCLDFQDYKRTVNNKQKGLEQSLNLVLPKMNAAMVDAQKLASKIELVRSQVCDTQETLKIQNDKMKYLVGRTVGTITKIDVLFDRFRTDILDYTSLTTEGNDGIDTRLSRLLKILCGLEDKDPDNEENRVVRDAFSEEGNDAKE